jgi:C_GCAxxG_C_C family probable redox protein
MVQGLSKEELLDKIEKTAQSYASKYHGCSRCVLLALQEHLNLGDDLTFQASTPLAGGIALRGETCGALTGGLLAVGLVAASKKIEDEAAFIHSLVAGFELCRRFEKEMGSTLCRELQKARLGRYHNLADPREVEEAKKAGLNEECPKIVCKACRLTAEFILELQEDKDIQH